MFTSLLIHSLIENFVNFEAIDKVIHLLHVGFFLEISIGESILALTI